MASARHYIWQRAGWTNFTWDNEEILSLLGQCRLVQGKLLGKVIELGLTRDVLAHAEVLAEETMKTSAIEGERLDIRSVRSSVARRLGLPSAGLPVDRNVDGLVAVLLDATINHDEPLTAERLHGWHAGLFPTGYSGMHKIRVGSWRGDEPMRIVSGPVGKEWVHFIAPPADRIPEEMSRFLSWWDSSRGSMEGLIRAALVHFRFVTIHPFEDGNGRIARVLTDMALAQDDSQKHRYYSLSSQIMEERDRYYDVLEACQKGSSNITQWLVWFLGCFSRAIGRSEMILSGVITKANFWRIHAQTSLNDRQIKVINKLLDAGPDGFEGGLTTRKYASLTNVSKPTAFREISRLLELGIVRQNPGKGRSASYDLVWP
ncbi:MAG: Fic family protein [Desulfomonilia bacterium]|nr:Fic family protein [Desulfomonilia bacterium]